MNREDTVASVKHRLKLAHFVDGKRVDPLSSNKYTSRDPFTNAELATFGLGGTADIERATGAARKAFDHGPWPHLSPKERGNILRRFAEGIEKEREFLGTLESLDVGKLRAECIDHDVRRAADNIRFFADQAEKGEEEIFSSTAKFLGKDVKTTSATHRYPAGVAALISPWNSPLMLATWKIGPCLACGNTCVVKPSEWALLTVLQLGEIANEAGVPPGVLNIVPGAAEAGRALVSEPRVDRVSFTGSVPTGKAVQVANAQARLAPVSLELGGKSPAIVFADADFDLALKGAARGIFRSQGQSCVAGSRLLIEQSLAPRFIPALVEMTQKTVMGDQLDPKTEVGPLITREHLDRVSQYVEIGKKEGAKLLTGGKRPQDSALSAGNFFEPTIFTGVTPDMTIWRDEIFGPVLCVATFKDEEEAIKLANSTVFGLSATVWTQDAEKAQRVAGAIDSGMVWINGHFVRDLRTPFGGVKESGVGSEGGKYSVEFFTRPKMICRVAY